MENRIRKLHIMFILLIFPFIINANEFNYNSKEQELINNINGIDSIDKNYIKNLTPSLNEKYKSNEYVIDEYKINIIVNENNTFDINETIVANFLIPKHGLKRIIPLKNNFIGEYGKVFKYDVEISHIDINDNYTTVKKNNNYIIQIGSELKTITGRKEYVINYDYILPKDKIKKYDELYFDIIGFGWDIPIGNISFSITMPKDFDSSKLEFLSEKNELLDNSKINYSIIENTITGKYNGILESNQGISVRCELEEGYFKHKTIINKTKLHLFLIIFGAVSLAIVIDILIRRTRLNRLFPNNSNIGHFKENSGKDNVDFQESPLDTNSSNDSSSDHNSGGHGGGGGTSW